MTLTFAPLSVPRLFFLAIDLLALQRESHMRKSGIASQKEEGEGQPGSGSCPSKRIMDLINTPKLHSTRQKLNY